MGQLQVSQRRDPAAAAVAQMHAWLAARGHDLPVQLWDGSRLGPDDAAWQLILREPWSLRSLLTPLTDLNAGEAYLADEIDVDGSMVAAMRAVAALRQGELDLSARLGALRAFRRLPAPPRGARRHRGRTRGRVRTRGRRHSPRRDRRVVRHHYDVGNDFYRLFLDPDLVYSCAVFAEEDAGRPVTDRDVLARAQRRKLELVCRKLHLRPGERLLDVGCGWGALVLHAARRHGVRAVGVTLSDEQAALARDLIERAGLKERVTVEVRDYREVTGEFDAIASVGMVEHVGAEQLPRYAAHLTGLLAPGGRLLNHGITTGGRPAVRELSDDPDSFVGRYIFPDGALVPAHETIAQLERAGLELWDVQQLRPHYARTLEHWVANLEAAAASARTLVDERTYRAWRAYMAGSVVGFEHNDLGIVQVLGVRAPVHLPFGRGWMEPEF